MFQSCKKVDIVAQASLQSSEAFLDFLVIISHNLYLESRVSTEKIKVWVSSHSLSVQTLIILWTIQCTLVTLWFQENQARDLSQDMKISPRTAPAINAMRLARSQLWTQTLDSLMVSMANLLESHTVAWFSSPSSSKLESISTSKRRSRKRVHLMEVQNRTLTCQTQLEKLNLMILRSVKISKLAPKQGSSITQMPLTHHLKRKKIELITTMDWRDY